MTAAASDIQHIQRLQ